MVELVYVLLLYAHARMRALSPVLYGWVGGLILRVQAHARTHAYGHARTHVHALMVTPTHANAHAHAHLTRPREKFGTLFTKHNQFQT